MTNAKLELNGQTYEFPVVVGSEGEVGIDTAKLRGTTKAITLDPGYGNTGSCQSAITFINGEEGVLHYRGYPIGQLAEKLSFEEVAYMLIWGELPTQDQLDGFKAQLDEHAALPASVHALIKTFPEQAHPMAVAQAAVAALEPASHHVAPADDVDTHIISLIAKFKSLAAAIYRHQKNQAPVAPEADLSYSGDFLQLMYARDGANYEIDDAIEEAINALLILHADHEQNCSASTVRMVGSSQASIYASVSAGIGALWGPLHGGANQRVLEMLQSINEDGADYEKYVHKAKDKDDGFRLMGFGHRVYKNYDPRATILKKSTDRVLAKLNKKDPLLDIAKQLEKVALEDEYFVQRKLFPNVDFYSGIIYRALGIPTNMFTVMFALGRLPGWIAQWKELRDDPKARIYRPRQIYTGETKRDVTTIAER
jgi:citrate synthase